MFTLVTIEDTVLVPSRLFGKPRLAALEHIVNKRFSDRVIPSVGLCIALWDWVSVGEDRLVIQTGESITECTFRLVVFRPFAGEVMWSKINASHESGIFLELGFFDAVQVPKDRFPQPTRWDEKEKVWIWTFSQEGQDEPIPLYMDVSTECVFRVSECKFEDRWAVKPSERDADGGRGAMWITGALYDDALEDNQGLGNPEWWDEGQEEEEEAGGEAEGGEGEGGEAGGDEGADEGGGGAAGAAGGAAGPDEEEYEEWDDADYVEEGDGDGELVADGAFERKRDDDD